VTPGEYDIEIYQGDTYYGDLIRLPSLASRGGPSDLVGTTQKAEIRESKDSVGVLAELDVEVISEGDRELRLKMDADDSLELEEGNWYWDLEITWGAIKKTPLAGRARVIAGVTR
jgi:hypothetical protein